ncbi:hypothetical protein GGX14DRAFT_575782 [Mycena pura]|uniref:Zn(2)-C6 fungal-type domain-containing protein n=1 Tax=Mycena pura TaxID=153505 RepID=A0AAD6UUZ3_9AGAR|nr:hypothetical protein GGX14DRAFT_575782 [Mycena pura]
MMSSASNNTTGGSGSGRNKGKARETSSDVARRIQLERRQAELAEQMAALQAELAQLRPSDDNNDNNDNNDNDDDNGENEEENSGGRAEETNAGQKRLAPEEGSEPAKKRRRKRYGPDVPNQWEADPFVPCEACQHQSSRCLPIKGQRTAGSSCNTCRRKKVKCSFVPVTEKSQVNRREKEKTGKPAGKSGQSTPRIAGAGLVPDSPIWDYLRGDPLEDLRTRMTAVEIRLGMEPRARLYRIEESELPSPMPPPPIPKVERLTSPQLVFEPDDKPNKGAVGPAEEGAEQREPEEEQPGKGALGEGQPGESASEEEQPGEGVPEEGQPAEEMEVDVPEEAAQVEVLVEAQVVVAPVEVPEEV